MLEDINKAESVAFLCLPLQRHCQASLQWEILNKEFNCLSKAKHLALWYKHNKKKIPVSILLIGWNIMKAGTVVV